MQHIKTVSKKGQVVIPVEIRKRLGIKRRVVFKEEQGKVTLEPFVSLEDAFGQGGEIMYEVAKGISEERRREVEVEGT